MSSSGYGSAGSGALCFTVIVEAQRDSAVAPSFRRTRVSLAPLPQARLRASSRENCLPGAPAGTSAVLESLQRGHGACACCRLLPLFTAAAAIWCSGLLCGYIYAVQTPRCRGRGCAAAFSPQHLRGTWHPPPEPCPGTDSPL